MSSMIFFPLAWIRSNFVTPKIPGQRNAHRFFHKCDIGIFNGSYCIRKHHTGCRLSCFILWCQEYTHLSRPPTSYTHAHTHRHTRTRSFAAHTHVMMRKHNENGWYRCSMRIGISYTYLLKHSGGGKYIFYWSLVERTPGRHTLFDSIDELIHKRSSHITWNEISYFRYTYIDHMQILCFRWQDSKFTTMWTTTTIIWIMIEPING